MHPKIFALFAVSLLLSVGLASYRFGVTSVSQPSGSIAPLARSTGADSARRTAPLLPISFEPNHGQADRQVQFLSRVDNGLLMLSSTQATFSAQGRQMRMQLRDANPDAVLSGYMPLEGTVNYLGKEQSITNIATYAGVAAQDVYPGINMVYHGVEQHQIAYDFMVAPGTDPRMITLHFADAVGLQIDHQGELVIQTASGSLRQRAPYLYQDIGGVRQAVQGDFTLKGKQDVGFTVGAYDRQQQLVIDPTLVYSTFLAPGDATAIAADAAGNTYIAGHDVTEVPYTGNDPGPWQGGTAKTGNAFVAKLNAAGTAVKYVTYFRSSVTPPSGQSFNVEFSDIAVDSSGNAIVTGLASTDFPTTPGSVQPTYRSPRPTDVTTYSRLAPVAAKISASGSRLVYSTYLGADVSSLTSPKVAIDANGNAYVVASTTDTTFPTTAGAYQRLYNGASQLAFLTELGPHGKLIYSTYLGGASAETIGTGVAVDAAGGVYVGGATNSPDFPTTQGAFQRTPTLDGRPYVTKFIPGATPLKYGLVLKYSTYVGNRAGLGDVAVDHSGNLYLTGAVREDGSDTTGFPTTPGAYRTTRPGGRSDMYVAKLNAAGSALVYSTFLGASDDERQTEGFSFGLAVDSTGAAWVTGQTDGKDYPTTPNALQTWHPLIRYGGQSDPVFVFVTKLHPNGKSLLYSTYLGGVEDLASLPDNAPSGLAMDGQGNVYVAGKTTTLDFPTTAGVFEPTNPLEGTGIGTSYGYDAGFVTKFSK